MIRNRIAAALLLCGSATAQAPADAIQKGVVVRRVSAQADPSQSYALYLPTAYNASKQWPVVFVFEPGARGPLPVSLMKDAAEKFGYIVVASNNSRNGPFRPQWDAAQAMWNDAQQRFNLDPRRTYFAGFSGGSRLAVTFTAKCKGCAAGVIACGAAFPGDMEPKSVPKFLYFGAVGDEDFNFPEYLEIEPKLKEAHFTYHLRRFTGGHEWPPADVFMDALEWFNLQAMKAGTLAKNEAFVEDAFARAMSNAAAQSNELERFRAYSQITADYTGLADIEPAQKLAADLEKTKTVQKLARQERDQAHDQRYMAAPINAHLEDLTDADKRVGAVLELRKLFAELKTMAGDDHDPKQLIAKRVRMQEFIHAYEMGMQMIVDKEYTNALILYDVIIQNAVAAPGAHLQKSRIYLLMGDKAKALAQAKLAVRDGVDDPEAFREPEFSALSSDPEFKALLSSLHPTKAE